LDPRHRPQVLDKPSSTVRREWARYPQEAHLLDACRCRIRRLMPQEIHAIQGFPPLWFSRVEISPLDSIRAAGDAVPPPLATAVFRAIADMNPWIRPSTVELCAGAGGLASGGLALGGFECLGLHEIWPPACQILSRHWGGLVVCGDIRKQDLRTYANRTGILSGGLPCQPWSRSGARRGHADPRELMGMADQFLRVIRPDAFVFENVPALLEASNVTYFLSLLRRLQTPEPGLEYGVLAATVNAADYGVPQSRRRLFIIGLRGRSQRDACRTFDQLHVMATHRRTPWKTLRDVIVASPQDAVWMRWPFDLPPYLQLGMMDTQRDAYA
jgi:site-specific DNA-cytosine methylase